MCLALALLLAGCGTFTHRPIHDAAPAAARLMAGGSTADEVDRLAMPVIESGDVVGITVGVVTPDGKSQVFGYGNTGLPGARSLPVGDTLIQTGSISKIFMVALLAQLVKEGEISYEDTVRDILPPEVELSPTIAEVTVRELAANTGGLPRQPTTRTQLADLTDYLFTGRPLYDYIDRDYLYGYLAKARVKPRNKREYAYSNVGNGLLAHLIEVKTARPYPELLDEKICRPLGMHDTTFTLNEEQKQRLALSHSGDHPWFVRRGVPLAPWDMGKIMSPVGCLYSTTNDLLKFAKAFLGMRGHPLEPVLQSTQKVQFSCPKKDVAMGWVIEPVGESGLEIIFMQGVISGYSGYIGMNPESQVAVVVLYNSFSWDETIGHNLILRLSQGWTRK